jgi:hypothetical protein
MKRKKAAPQKKAQASPRKAQAKRSPKGKAKPPSKGKKRAKAKGSAKPPIPAPAPLADTPARLPTTLEILQNRTRLPEPTDELIVSMCYLIKQGSTIEAAARAMGVPRSVFRRWIELGIMEMEDPHSTYGRMLLALDAADAQDEVSDLQLISMGARWWAALAWKRERKTPGRWGAKPTPLVDLDQHSRAADIPELQEDEAARVMAIMEMVGLLNQPQDPSVIQAEASPQAKTNGHG